MKVLVVTGLLAEAAVCKSVGDAADILVLPTPVAALITPQKLLSGFSNSEFSKNKYDAILVSGFSKFNFSKIEAEIGSPIFLGSKHAVDLKPVLTLQVFSKSVPACELIQNQKKELAVKMLQEHESEELPVFHIGSVSIGGNARMKILAEIVAAESLNKTELKTQVYELISDGADLIDLGFSPDADEQSVSFAVSFVKSFCPVPVSIDSGSFSQIQAGISSGADLVLSADSRILDQLKSFSFDRSILKQIAFVIIPDLFSGNDILETLNQNIKTAREIGIQKIIADPILSPPGHDLFTSLKRYADFHQKNPDIPVLFGAGNVTELFDADSVGINALLAEIANECGASILFTPNAGDKGKGSIRELKTASEMMVLSNIRNSSPKDLGVDLLILKEKRKRPEFDLSRISKSGVFDSLHLKDDELFSGGEFSSKDKFKINSNVSDNSLSFSDSAVRAYISTGVLNPNHIVGEKWGWKADPCGNFLIGVLSVSNLIEYLMLEFDFDENASEIQKLNELKTPGKRVIVAVHQKAVIAGTDSAFMLESILNHRLISELGHAGYLGRELQKAEIAVILGRSYSQDDGF